MKKNERKVKTVQKKRRTDYLKTVCWMIVPAIVVALLVLDALGVYSFNTERLIVLGVGLLMILLPFFSEITVKDISVKRGKSGEQTEDTRFRRK